MYFVKYGDEYLHDPRITERTLLDLTLDCEENSCGFCDFTIYPNHPLYNIIKEYGHVIVYDDDKILFSGYIYELGKEFYLDGHVKCKGDLAYFNMSILTPRTKTFYNIRDYLNWIVIIHNSQVNNDKQFKLGNIQDKHLEVDIKIDSYKTVLDELSSTLSEKYKNGILSVRIENGIRYLDYKYKYEKNDQVIDFGVNLTDYSLTDNFENLATYVIPIGAKLKDTDEYLNLRSLPNGPLHENRDIVKDGNRIYSKTAVAKYGWIGKAYSNTEIEDTKNLLNEAIKVLKDAIEPDRTIEIKAVDMHLINPDIKPIAIGEYIRVRSGPHNMDTYFLCRTINLDLNNPENSIYTFGKKTDTFTSTYKKSIKSAVEDTWNDIMTDNQSTSSTSLKQIKVKTTGDDIDEVSFVYETVTYKPDDTEGDGNNSGGNVDIIEDAGGDDSNSGNNNSGGNVDIIEDAGGSGSSDNTNSNNSEISTSEESYACEYDSNGRLIKFGTIEIVWV